MTGETYALPSQAWICGDCGGDLYVQPAAEPKGVSLYAWCYNPACANSGRKFRLVVNAARMVPVKEEEATA